MDLGGAEAHLRCARSRSRTRRREPAGRIHTFRPAPVQRCEARASAATVSKALISIAPFPVSARTPAVRPSCVSMIRRKPLSAFALYGGNVRKSHCGIIAMHGVRQAEQGGDPVGTELREEVRNALVRQLQDLVQEPEVVHQIVGRVWIVSLRKSRMQSACFSGTTTLTRRASQQLAGRHPGWPTPTMQHCVEITFGIGRALRMKARVPRASSDPGLQAIPEPGNRSGTGANGRSRCRRGPVRSGGETARNDCGCDRLPAPCPCLAVAAGICG